MTVTLLTLESYPPTADRHFTQTQSLTIGVTFPPFVSYMQNLPYEDTKRKKYFDLRFLQYFQKPHLFFLVFSQTRNRSSSLFYASSQNCDK